MERPESVLEVFYVYRSLHSDESWGAVIAGSQCRLPNCSFLIQVHAANEKEAISRGKSLYEGLHKFDSERENVKKFTAAALQALVNKCELHSTMTNPETTQRIAEAAVKIAVATNAEFEKYAKTLE